MKMSRKLISGLAVVIILGTQNIALAATIEGSACSKVSSQTVVSGKLYKCSWVGQKLKWVYIPQASAKPTPAAKASAKPLGPTIISSPMAMPTKYPSPTSRQQQSLSLPQIANIILFSRHSQGRSKFSYSPQTSSGLMATVTTLTPSICSYNQGEITMTAAGQCTLEVSQAGDGSFAAITPVRVNFEAREECKNVRRDTGNGGYMVFTCYVGSRTVASSWCCSYTPNLYAYEYVGGSKVVLGTFTTSMIYRYAGGTWQMLNPVENSSYAWGKLATSKCTVSSYNPATGVTTCQEGGFDTATIERIYPGVGSYCFATSASLARSGYCNDEFEINWIAKDF